MSTTEIIIVGLMLVLNGFFAAYELALASVGLGRLTALAAEKKPGARAALAMKNRMEASLAVVQIGITLAGALAAAMTGAGAEEYISPWLVEKFGFSEKSADGLAIGLVVLPLSALTIIVGELVPKTFALRNAELVCLALSPWMRMFALMAYPAVVSFEWITKLATGVLMRRMAPAGADGEAGLGELRAQAHLLRAARVLGAQEERMIVGASKIALTKLGDVLLPAADIVMLHQDGKLTDHIITAHLEAHTRFPVTTIKGDAQGIVGYVNVKELIFLPKTHPANPHIKEITRPIISLPASLTVSQAFTKLMGEHAHLALVRGAKDEVLGMVTLEDLLEEVVGDIQDEFDRLPRHMSQVGSQWMVGGGVTLERLRLALGRPVFAADAPGETVLADWMAHAKGSALHGGDVIERDGVRLMVKKMRRQRLLEAQAEAIGEDRGVVGRE
jgi:putative hemolysin